MMFLWLQLPLGILCQQTWKQYTIRRGILCECQTMLRPNLHHDHNLSSGQNAGSFGRSRESERCGKTSVCCVFFVRMSSRNETVAREVLIAPFHTSKCVAFRRLGSTLCTFLSSLLWRMTPKASNGRRVPNRCRYPSIHCFYGCDTN